MDSDFIKQIGIACIVALGGFFIWITAKIGTLNLSIGDIALIAILIACAIYVGYVIIKKYTGASVSDVGELLDFIRKLRDAMDGDKESSNSTESTTS